MAVHRAARADHHVESARFTGESAPARRVATPRHRQAADLRAGDLRLRCIAAASGLRHVVGTVMLGSGLSRDRNHEYSEGKCDGFHNGLSWLHSPIERANRCLDPSGTSIQVIVPLVPGERRSKTGVCLIWTRRMTPRICGKHEPSCPKSCGPTSPKSKLGWTRTARISLGV